MLRLSLQTGFSLLELLVVLMLISVVGTIAIRSTVDIGYATRYEQTRDRLESIRTAIIGNPKRSINGQPDIAGFVADMGRLPVNVRELVQRLGDCDDDNFDYSATDCTDPANGGAWTPGVWNDNKASVVDSESNLRHGWNGPYLNISGDPSLGDAYTDGWGREAQGYCSDPTITAQASCIGSDVWTPEANDFNYGWYFDSSTSPDLTLFSYGRDGVSGGSANDYTADYPAATAVISSKDWEVSVDRGIDVGFVKLSMRSEISAPPASFCSDASYQNKGACEGALPPGIWYGGCKDKVGYFNSASCGTAGGTWASCSDDTSLTKIACEAVPATWYGVGAGCSDQQYIDRVACEGASGTWYSCSDGTSMTENDCEVVAGEIWYGDTLYTPVGSATFSTQQVCLKLFYRGADSTLVKLPSDNQISITEDGSYQSLHFSFSVATIPAGVNAVGLYKYTGSSCSDILYPDDRTAVVPVLARGGSDFPFVNW